MWCNQSEFSCISIPGFLQHLGVAREDSQRIYDDHIANEAITDLTQLVEYYSNGGNIDVFGLPGLLAVRMKKRLDRLHLFAEDFVPMEQRSTKWNSAETRPRLIEASIAGIFSFASKRTFTFKDNHLFLVGPNGGGKSNFAKSLLEAVHAFSNPSIYSLAHIKNTHCSALGIELHYSIKTLPDEVLQSTVESIGTVSSAHNKEDIMNVIRSRIKYFTAILKQEENQQLEKYLDLQDENRKSLYKIRIDSGEEKLAVILQQPLYEEVRDMFTTNHDEHKSIFLQGKMKFLLEGSVVLHRSNSSLSHFDKSFVGHFSSDELMTLAKNQLSLPDNGNALHNVNEKFQQLCGWSFCVRWSLIDFIDQLKQGIGQFLNRVHQTSDKKGTTLELERILELYETGRFTPESIKELFEFTQEKYSNLESCIKEILGVNVSFKKATEILFEKDEQTMSIQQISGGTRDIFTVIFLLHFSTASTIILDEPGASLHPPLRRRLLDLLMEKLDRQLVVITHSQELVDPKMIPYTYHCHSVPSAGTIAARLEDIVTSDKERSMILEPSLKSLLFAERVLFVEGNTDDVVIQALVQSRIGASKSALIYYVKHRSHQPTI